MVNLTCRKARCAYCQTVKPSSQKLPFFEYRGEGSEQGKNLCKCGYHRVAHDPEYTKNNVEKRTVVQLGKCKGFEARGAFEFDSYYCGCRGWD